MKKVRLGSVMHVSKSSGNLILRAEAKARIGDNVFNKQGKRVGRVFDLFGPVEKPYTSVKPSQDPERLVGKPLYVNPPRKGK